MPRLELHQYTLCAFVNAPALLMRCHYISSIGSDWLICQRIVFPNVKAFFFFFFFKLAKFVGQIPSVADINASVRGSSCQWFLEPVCWLFISHWGAEQQTVVTNVKLLDQWTQSRRFTTIRFHIRADRSGSDTEIVMDLFVTLIFNLLSVVCWIYKFFLFLFVSSSWFVLSYLTVKLILVLF